jgi:alkylation response protein AidB-like acyl-CoA dehydrogenase
MAFNIDERDVFFCLFEQLDAVSLTKLSKFKEQDEDLYRMIVSEAIKFAREQVAPTNLPADEEGVHMKDGVVKMPPMFHQLYKSYCESGWNSVAISADAGGQGLPALVSAGASESMVGANCSFIMTAGLTAAAVRVLQAFGTPEMKSTYLPKMVSGEWSGTMCLTEPNAGTAVGDVRTAAKANPDGTYLITGTKMFITSGDHDLTKNIIHLVLARTEKAPKGIKGLSLFVVPKMRVNPDGSVGKFNDVICSKVEEKMGIHGSATCMLNFGDAGECVGYIIGKDGDGIALMFNMMNEARIGVGMQGVAMGSAAYQMALAYSKERIQGTSILAMKDPNAPRVAIIEHPDVRRMLMEMKAYSEGGRALVYFTAKVHDLADHAEDEETRKKYGLLLELLTPITKAFPTDRAFEISSMAMQVLAGVGYCREYGVEQYVRDSRISAIYEGTNGVQALDLVGRKMTMKGGAAFMTYMSEIAAFLEKNAGHAKHGDLVADLTAARDKLVEIAMHFMQVGMSNPIYPVLSASPFLVLFGHVVMGHLLLDQAVIAQGKLDAIAGEKGATDMDALAKSDLEALFYYNKTLTARFFVKNLLPCVDGIAKRILTGDESCLKAVL